MWKPKSFHGFVLYKQTSREGQFLVFSTKQDFHKVIKQEKNNIYYVFNHVFFIFDLKDEFLTQNTIINQ